MANNDRYDLIGPTQANKSSVGGQPLLLLLLLLLLPVCV